MVQGLSLVAWFAELHEQYVEGSNNSVFDDGRSEPKFFGDRQSQGIPVCAEGLNDGHPALGIRYGNKRGQQSGRHRWGARFFLHDFPFTNLLEALQYRHNGVRQAEQYAHAGVFHMRGAFAGAIWFATEVE